jgi:hypothetical protein
MPLVTCPACDHEQVVPREMSGLEVQCENCRAEFRADDGTTPRRGRGRRRRPPARSAGGFNPGWVAACLAVGGFGLAMTGAMIRMMTKASMNEAERALNRVGAGEPDQAAHLTLGGIALLLGIGLCVLSAGAGAVGWAYVGGGNDSRPWRVAAVGGSIAAALAMFGLCVAL